MLRWLASLFSWGYARHIDPPVFGPYTDQQLALGAAQYYAAGMGDDCQVYITSGTPSMVPLIPASPTYVVVQTRKSIDGLLGRVLTYRAKWSPAGPPTHRAVSKDKYGLIMSGDGNAHTESFDRVTSDNLIGEVIAMFLFPSSSNSTATKPQ